MKRKMIVSYVIGVLVTVCLLVALTSNRGTTVNYQDESRPACFVEPNQATSEGVEVIYYPHLSMKHSSEGLEVNLRECGR